MAAVVRRDHEHAHGFQVELLGYIAHGKEVAQRLGHLLIVHVYVAVMHPVMYERLAGRALGLSDFVFVVREQQILAAAVYVDRLAQILHAHRGALDMPAGATHSPRAGPGGFAGLLRLPQGEVHRMSLGIIHVYARAGFQIFEVLS